VGSGGSFAVVMNSLLTPAVGLCWGPVGMGSCCCKVRGRCRWAYRGRRRRLGKDVGVGSGSGKCDRPRESIRDTFLREVKEKYQNREDLGKKAQFSLLLLVSAL